MSPLESYDKTPGRFRVDAERLGPRAWRFVVFKGRELLYGSALQHASKKAAVAAGNEWVAHLRQPKPFRRRA